MNKLNYFLVLTIGLFLTSFSIVRVINNEPIKLETMTPEEYDEGYKEGYCEGWREALDSRYAPCPRVPYIQNAPYLSGCESWKCGYNAGFKHGKKDGKGPDIKPN